MPLRSGSSHAPCRTRNRDELQLLTVPAHRRNMGLLRARHGFCPRPSRKHRELRVGRSHAAQLPLQDLRHRYPLGTRRAHARRSPRREPAKLRTRAAGICGHSAVRRRRYVEVHRLIARSFLQTALASLQVPPNNSSMPTPLGGATQLIGMDHELRARAGFRRRCIGNRLAALLHSGLNPIRPRCAQ